MLVSTADIELVRDFNKTNISGPVPKMADLDMKSGLHLNLKVVSFIGLAIFAVFILLSPAIAVFASSGPYNLTVSPNGGYNSSTSTYTVGPGTGTKTFVATTSDTAVTQIVISGACSGSTNVPCPNSPGNSFSGICTGSPILPCSLTPDVTYSA